MGSVDLSADEERPLVDGVAALGAAAKVQVQVTILGDPDSSIDVSTTVLRLVQEGITNAMKHAPGASVDVTVRARADQLDVEVRNEAAELTRSDVVDLGSGLGLAGLRERIDESGGRFEAGPTADGGWRLFASFAPYLGPTGEKGVSHSGSGTRLGRVGETSAYRMLV
jgi:signal transduction histidine kinase